MTSLPVDYTKKPWRAKYLTEETSVLNYWFIFGERKDGTVDVSDPDQDIFENVPIDVASKIIEARHKFCQTIEEIFCNFEEV